MIRSVNHHARPWLLRLGDPNRGRDVALYDQEAIDHTLELVRALGRWLPCFPTEATGFSNLPPPPALLVMNHSGGDTVLDVWGFMYAWHRHFGAARPLRPLAHEVLLEQALTGPFLVRRGVLQADSEVAHRALTRMRHDVLVMPGGDLETWRPFRDRHRVCFHGRTGYLKLAARAGVPIVPVAHVGAHATFIVLTRGEKLARAMHLHELARADVFPIHLSLPWGLGIGPLPHLPWPTRLRYVIGEPIALPSADALAPDLALALDARVRDAIQAGVDLLLQQDRPRR